jgi:hypothetical protein
VVRNVLPILRILRSDSSAEVLIEVEVPHSKRQEFDANYRRATGTISSPGDYYRVIDNKWGIELRLYVNAAPATITELQSHCSVTTNTGIRRDKYPYRINDNDLIRWLFRDGYRLGPNDPQNL